MCKRAILGITALAIGSLLVASLNASAATTKNPQDERASRIGAVAVTVGKNLAMAVNDPQSLRFDTFELMKDDSICVVFRGRNPQGGMQAMTVVMLPDGKGGYEANPQNGKLWNAHCKGKSGDDYSELARMGAKSASR